MGRFDVRWLRLAVAAGAIAGSALVSSAVVATEESPPIDDITVIEMVVVEPGITASGSGSDAIESEATEPEATVAEASQPGSTALHSGETDAELRSAPVATPLEPADVEGDHDDGEGGSGHDDGEGGSGHDDGEGGSGHDGREGGKVGEGTPYLMTFEVVWLEPNETQIGDLDAVLPLEWRSWFELSAASVTGLGPTSATCTYPAGDDVLHCVFENAGHGWESEGLIIPGSKEKTYTVTVAWSPEDWTIDGANDDSYSARELCPRGGHEGNGSDDGHDDEGSDGHDDEGSDGHDGGQGGGHGEERRTFPCVHTVTMRQIVVPPTEPPAVEPQPQPEPESEPQPEAVAPVVPESQPETETEAIAPVAPEPEANPSVVTPEVVVEASPVAAATLRALPATGNSVSVLLVLAGLLVAAGSTLTRFARRTS